jgi:hypothetical protein
VNWDMLVKGGRGVRRERSTLQTGLDHVEGMDGEG